MMTKQYYLQDFSGAIGLVGTQLSIPPDSNNADYQKYLKWVDEGGVVTPVPEGTPRDELTVRLN